MNLQQAALALMHITIQQSAVSRSCRGQSEGGHQQKVNKSSKADIIIKGS